MRCVLNDRIGGGVGHSAPTPIQQVESIHFLSGPRLSPATHLDFLLLCWQFTKKNRAIQQHHEIKNEQKNNLISTLTQLYTIIRSRQSILTILFISTSIPRGWTRLRDVQHARSSVNVIHFIMTALIMFP